MLRKNSLMILIIPICLCLLAYEVLIAKGETYYYTALGIIMVGLIGFFIHFESGKPSAILLTMIASLCALAIGSRIAFFFLPQIKPIAAIVILAGIAFGTEVGFVTGAVSAFVSNFYFGQGSWTPFQMFALGIIGAMAGLLFCGRKYSGWQVTLYGFLSVFFLYGGIVDLNTIFFTSQVITASQVFAIYAAAVPFDLLFAFSTAVFLFLLRKPILKKIGRVQTKYWLVDKSNEK